MNNTTPFLLSLLLPALLSPLASASEAKAPVDVRAVIATAIDQGVPAFNAGDVEGCVRIYRTAATTLTTGAGDALPVLDRLGLEAALGAAAKTERERAWTLRKALDAVVLNLDFEPVREADLPAGFPEPGPVGRVVMKTYPRYRAARAQGGNSFWTLFRHIKKNDVAMTAPVEMTMGAAMKPVDMAFLYGSPTQGEAGTQGRVQVLDLAPLRVASIGVRGRRSDVLMARARKALEAHLAEEGLEAAGSWRVLGYNSPMVPSAKQYWELQVPVGR